MFHHIFLQNILLMISAIILIKTEADQWGVCGGLDTPFLPNYYKKCTKLALIKNKNLWGGESPMSPKKIWTRYYI